MTCRGSFVLSGSVCFDAWVSRIDDGPQQSEVAMIGCEVGEGALLAGATVSRNLQKTSERTKRRGVIHPFSCNGMTRFMQ